MSGRDLTAGSQDRLMRPDRFSVQLDPWNTPLKHEIGGPTVMLRANM
jgi:hypothetical protein